VLQMKQILRMAFDKQDKLTYWRRALHAIAEPAFQENKTANFLAKELKKMGVEVCHGVGGGTGLTALLKTKTSSATVALRAEMDALPIVEKTGLPFASQNGFMHACGHDAHMAILLGVAFIWTSLGEENLPGNLLLIFQPAEEQFPGGALKMIEAGVLEKPVPKAIFGLHVHPDLSTGMAGFKAGPLMAAADSFILKVIGRGGHGANPHEAVDAVTVSSNIIQSWQQVVSRMIDPLEPVVVSIGTINGGSKFNIIAEEVEMTGTLRTLSTELREKLPKILENMARQIAAGFGARCEFTHQKGYPVLFNDKEKTTLFQKAARNVFGEKGVLELEKPRMGADDMAYFLQKVPGSLAFLGSKPPQQETYHPLHSPTFDLDENCLPLGAALLAGAAYLALR
jgi:amidohydrolase